MRAREMRRQKASPREILNETEFYLNSSNKLMSFDGPAYINKGYFHAADSHRKKVL